ncbi:MAG: nitroreductase family protein [Dethiobacteria bacterium]|jgi:nitroreductase
METRECIKNRRSIRNFTEQEITGDVLSELLEAVRWSPSWANTQCWELVVVKDHAKKEKLAELLADRNPATKAVTQAPLVIVFCGKKGKAGYKKGTPVTEKGDWYMFDLGIACQNFCLAAHDMGLGTVQVGSFDHQGVNKLLGVPADVESVAIIPVGYPAKESTAPPRKEINEFVYLDNYGNNLETLG